MIKWSIAQMKVLAANNLIGDLSLQELGLKKYIAKDASVPGEAKGGEPT